MVKEATVTTITEQKVLVIPKRRVEGGKCDPDVNLLLGKLVGNCRLKVSGERSDVCPSSKASHLLTFPLNAP